MDVDGNQVIAHLDSSAVNRTQYGLNLRCILQLQSNPARSSCWVLRREPRPSATCGPELGRTSRERNPRVVGDDLHELSHQAERVKSNRPTQGELCGVGSGRVKGRGRPGSLCRC